VYQRAPSYLITRETRPSGATDQERHGGHQVHGYQ
jgi:hypothetical protein